MKNRWGKGDPVDLSDLLKITPVANEILHLSEELNISTHDIMWIVNQIIDTGEDLNEQEDDIDISDDTEMSLDEEWDSMDLENLEDEMEQAMYLVNVKINSTGRFPEIGFKAGINDREDMNYFFDMVLEMLDKLE